jgi:antitoxin component YwqK of YwqJK toxin-antitoxin module
MKHTFFLSLLICLISCQPEDYFKDEEKRIYYPGTEIIKQSVQYKNGKKNGYLKEYYRDGKLKASQYYRNDTLNDTTVMYHPNGKLKLIHIYKNTLKHGCWRDYNKEGKLYSELFFKEGRFDSICSKYSIRSVQLLTRVRYNDGIKHGLEESYYPGEKIKSRSKYFRGELCKGTEEWRENGKKINNDFKITVSEKDATLLENTLVYVIRLENPKPDDRVYRLFKRVDGDVIGDRIVVQKEGDSFIYKFDIPKGGFVMEEIFLAVYRKTAFGNTVIKTTQFNAASNNF